MTPQEQPPKLPPFKPAGKREDAWPPLGGSLSLRGGAAPGWPERLRRLSPREIAFILAGISVLMMAPLAEYFLTAPAPPEGVLSRGFDRKGPLFEDGTSLFEVGTGGFSPGALLGEGADVITPLNVRDPSALIMGPGAVQRAPATGAPEPAAAPKGPAGWKDALSEAAASGAKAGARAAPKLPKPDVKLAGALRGLSALSGASSGGGPSLKLEPLSASNVPNRAKDSAALTRSQAVPGFRGPASRSPATAGAEGLKDAGHRQADILNRGPAVNALQTAAQESMPRGGGAGLPGGGPGGGGADKAPDAGGQSKDSKQLGESLAFLRAKMEMERAVKRKHDKLDWQQLGRRKMIEELMFKTAIEGLLGKGLFEPMGKAVAGAVGKMMGSPATKYYYCPDGQGRTVPFDEVLEGYDGAKVIQKKSGEGSLPAECPSGWRLVGGSGGAAGARPAAEDERRIPGSSVSDRNPGPGDWTEVRAESTGLAELHGRHCGPEAANRYGSGFCEGLRQARGVAEKDLPALIRDTEGLYRGLGDAQKEMAYAGVVLGVPAETSARTMPDLPGPPKLQGASSLESLEGAARLLADPAGSSARAEAVEALSALKMAAENQDLSVAVWQYENARTRVTVAAEEHVAKALGPSFCQSPGETALGPACRQRALVEEHLAEAGNILQGIDREVPGLRKRADAALASLGAAEKTAAGERAEARRTLAEAVRPTRERLAALRRDAIDVLGLTKEPSSYSHEADRVLEDHMRPARDAVYGNSGPYHALAQAGLGPEAADMTRGMPWRDMEELDRSHDGLFPDPVAAGMRREIQDRYRDLQARVSGLYGPEGRAAEAQTALTGARERVEGAWRTLNNAVRKSSRPWGAPRE